MKKLENLDEVVKLFMQENDKKALKKLYKITKKFCTDIVLLIIKKRIRKMKFSSSLF